MKFRLAAAQGMGHASDDPGKQFLGTRDLIMLDTNNWTGSLADRHGSSLLRYRHRRSGSGPVQKEEYGTSRSN